MPRPQRFEYMLEYGMTNWVTSNGKVRAAIEKPQRLLKYQERDVILVHLDQFRDDYKRKFIAPNPEAYCDKLLQSLERQMFSTLAFIGLDDYRFTFRFQFRGQIIQRQVSYYFISRTREVR